MSDWDPDPDPEGDDDGILTELTVFAVLGAGFLGLFLGAEWFWMVWVFGFAVVLPVVSILEGRLRSTSGSGGRYAPDHHRDSRRESRRDEEDALETLKRRYAEGELDDVEFERRLERLVENESIEDVERRVERDPEVGDRNRTGGDNDDRDRDRDLEYGVE